MCNRFDTRRLRAAAARALGAAVLACLAGAPADAQSSVSLSLDEAVKMALEHNLDIVVDRLEPQVSRARADQAGAAYLPNLTGSFTRNSVLSPPSSSLTGSVQTDVSSGGVTLSQRLPWFGSSVAVGWDGTRTTTGSILSAFNPSLTGRVQATWSQPLLRDLTIDSTRQQLIISKRNSEISDARFRETVVRTLDTVRKAYWDLVSARSSVDVQQQSLKLAQELVRLDQARVTVGQMPELDLLAAQAEVAQRQEALTIAEVNARQAEDRLRTLIFEPGRDKFWDTALVTTDQPEIGRPLPDVDAAVSHALKNRWDLVRARKDLENAQTTSHFYSNQRLPDLRVIANYQANGLSGDRLVRSGFLGPVVSLVPGAYSDAMHQVWGRDYPTWTVGVTLSYPIGHSFEDAALASARLQEAQAKARLDSLEMRVVRQIRQAAWQLEMNRRRIETSRAARQLAERRLDAEQKRFEVGMSTSFLVVQAQRDLAQARNNELSAMLDYSRSLTDFDALQEAALDGATVTVSSGGVTPAGAVPAATTQSSLSSRSSGM